MSISYYAYDMSCTKLNRCIISRWLFYANQEYNTQAKAGVEYVWGLNNYCDNLKSIGGYVSSVRFAGDPNDFRTSTFTLYEEDWFQVSFKPMLANVEKVIDCLGLQCP
jgi:hypothetical protein